MQRFRSRATLGLACRAVAREIALILVVLLVLVVATPRLSFVEVRALDFLYALRPRHQLDPRIVVVDAEQDSGAPRHLRDPEDPRSICSRRAYAEAARRLARWGAAVVVFDLQLDERCRQDDRDLAAAFREAGNVVVAAVARPDPRDALGVKLEEPVDGLGKAAWAVGSPVTYRPNGIIRSVPLVAPSADGGSDEALCLAAFQRLRGVARKLPALVGGRWLVTAGVAVPVLSGERVSLLGTGWLHGGASLALIGGRRAYQVPGPNTWSIMLVNWVGPPGTVRARPLSELLTASEERGRGLFAGKAVLIGRAGADAWATSVGKKMPGLEIQANALHTLVSGAFIRPLSPWGTMVLLVLFILVTELAARRLPALPALGAVLLVMAAAGVTARQLLVGRGIWVYLFSCELGIGLTWGATAIAESGKAAALLRRFVPSFVGRPRAAGRAPARTLDASILFADIRGSTGSAEQLSAADTMAMLTAYSTALERVITRQGGSIVRRPGDAVVAIFWRARGTRNHATCALQAASEILRELPETAKAWEAAGARLMIGIGLNSGPVATGLVGARYLEPTVIGDTVNVAQRLEELTKTLGHPLILSEAVRERLPAAEAAAAVYLDEVMVRGRRTPIRVYAVEGASDPGRAPQARSSAALDGGTE